MQSEIIHRASQNAHARKLAAIAVHEHAAVRAEVVLHGVSLGDGLGLHERLERVTIAHVPQEIIFDDEIGETRSVRRQVERTCNTEPEKGLDGSFPIGAYPDTNIYCVTLFFQPLSC